jgi:hypothetical protein
MIRTQVSLEEKEYELAKQQAKALGISIAEFVRRAVRDALPPAGEAPWMWFAGSIESGGARSSSSESIDEVVYGTKD